MREWRALFGNPRLHFEIVQLQLNKYVPCWNTAACTCLGVCLIHADHAVMSCSVSASDSLLTS